MTGVQHEGSRRGFTTGVHDGGSDANSSRRFTEGSRRGDMESRRRWVAGLGARPCAIPQMAFRFMQRRNCYPQVSREELWFVTVLSQLEDAVAKSSLPFSPGVESYHGENLHRSCHSPRAESATLP